MPNPLQGVFIYTLLPIVAVIVGGIMAAFRAPGPRAQSYVQHFAAGVVFAATAGEVIPQMMHERDPLGVMIGFTLGVAAMLGLRWLTEKSEPPGEAQVEQPTSLLVTVGIDLLIDGLLVGLGFAAGAEAGVLLTFALTLEILFLGLSMAAALSKAGASRRRVIATAAGLGALVAVGAAIGVTLLSGLSGRALEVVLSFGVAALLYLVTEELLVEAHEVPETPTITATFFLGFLVLFLLEMAA